MKISEKVNINIMSLKDDFLLLYGFTWIWWTLTQNISGWVMDWKLIFRHLDWHFKDDLWAMEFWTSGRNVAFQNVVALVLGLLYNYAVSPSAASFLLLICVLYSYLLTPITAGVFFSVSKVRFFIPSYGHRSNACAPLEMPHMVLWPWTLYHGLHFRRNNLFPPVQKNFSFS